MSLTSLCRGTADIEAPTASVSTMGGTTRSWAVSYNDQPCTRQDLSGRVVEEFARRQIQVSHVFYFPVPLTVRSGYRVVYNSAKYLVQHVEDLGGRGKYTAIYALRKD